MTTKTLSAPDLTNTPAIPDAEFHQRVASAQRLVKKAGLDAMIANSNEADFAHVRYFSNYWTLFERAGVFIPAEGEAALLSGPESVAYAKDRSKIDLVYQMLEYRESADPDYPGLAVTTFKDIFKAAGITSPKKIGIAGYLITPAHIIDSLKEAFPDAELVRCDEIMINLRSIKSEAEIACQKKAFAISELATQAVLEKIRPGLTEQQVVGIAQAAMYENGAEYEGHPTYVFSGRGTRHAISRPTTHKLEKGELVQLNIGALVSGYSSSIGVPVCLGKMDSKTRDLADFGLDAHAQTIEKMKLGVPAADVAKWFVKLYNDRGYGDYFLYGPCHGLGMLEVEQPWLEETSNYALAENMTFQIDTFLTGGDYGMRFENGGRVTPDGFEMYSGKFRKVIEIE